MTTSKTAPAKKAAAKRAAPARTAAKGVDDYPVGAGKQDPATKAIAVRADTARGAPMPWAVMTVLNGGHWEKHENVADWPDLDGTPVPDPEPEPEPVDGAEDETPEG